MKVHELIELLQQADPNDLVVLSRDEEGNGYNELIDVSLNQHAFVGGYGHTSSASWGGYIGYRTGVELPPGGYTEEDRAPADAMPCAVLWP